LAAATEKTLIRTQADRILASGVLGRSRFYTALFEYLLECRERGHTPKEVEIAAAVFNRGEEFDPSQDSMVRVYAHNLRQKLHQYYHDQGPDQAEDPQRQITIPKGEYRITLAEESAPAPPEAAAEDRHRRHWQIGIAVLVIASVAAGFVLDRIVFGGESVRVRGYESVAASPLWSAVTDDDLPVTIVVGDYYIFGELDDIGNISRMVREFDVNSSRDLDEKFMLEPEAADRYIDLDMTYLPSSTASAMRDLMAVLAAADKEVHVVAISHLDPTVLRESHIVYVGFLSGLGMLSDFVFSGSELKVGDTYDELIDRDTGESFVSEAGLPSERGSYRDYGLFSTMPGPAGNQFVFIAGTRDEGLMQTAEAVSDPAEVPASVDAITAAGGKASSGFELLYEVAGLDRTNLDARIVHASPLSRSRIAVGHLVN
jgi:hypothetical protein